MDKIINVLLLIIIFVFDPLAISLVVAANFAFDKAFPKRKKNLYGEYEATSEKLYEEALEEAKGSVPDGLEFNKTYTHEEVSEAFKNMDEKRMDIIGQNGNDGLHYSDSASLEEQAKHTDWGNNEDVAEMDSTDLPEDLVWVNKKEEKKEKKIIKVLERNIQKWQVLFDDSSVGWLSKHLVIKNYPNLPTVKNYIAKKFK